VTNTYLIDCGEFSDEETESLLSYIRIHPDVMEAWHVARKRPAKSISISMDGFRESDICHLVLVKMPTDEAQYLVEPRSLVARWLEREDYEAMEVVITGPRMFVIQKQVPGFINALRRLVG
jgi:hypothetical protein